LVLGRHRVDVLMAATVVGQVHEEGLQTRNVARRVGRQAFRAPEHHVVGVRRHHRAAVVVHVGEHQVEADSLRAPERHIIRGNGRRTCGAGRRMRRQRRRSSRSAGRHAQLSSSERDGGGGSQDNPRRADTHVPSSPRPASPGRIASVPRRAGAARGEDTTTTD
jgi:hypothetical protein